MFGEWVSILERNLSTIMQMAEGLHTIQYGNGRRTGVDSLRTDGRSAKRHLFQRARRDRRDRSDMFTTQDRICWGTLVVGYKKKSTVKIIIIIITTTCDMIWLITNINEWESPLVWRSQKSDQDQEKKNPIMYFLFVARGCNETVCWRALSFRIHRWTLRAIIKRSSMNLSNMRLKPCRYGWVMR